MAVHLFSLYKQHQLKTCLEVDKKFAVELKELLAADSYKSIEVCMKRPDKVISAVSVLGQMIELSHSSCRQIIVSSLLTTQFLYCRCLDVVVVDLTLDLLVIKTTATS